MRVTLKDVAKEAGVSISTVSRVVRNADYIDASTREKVLDAINKLQYRPNPAARRLKYGRTYTIGFVINDITNPFFGYAAIGAERHISEFADPEFELFMANTSRDPKKETRAIELMLEKPVEGLILASTAAPECLEAAHTAATKHHIPVVSIDNDLGGFETGVVTADNRLGGYQLTRHLLQVHGHRRFGIISGPQEESHARERVEGCCQALAEFGLSLEDALFGVGNWSFEDGYRIASAWLKTAHPPTAIFSSNNLMCMGALYAIQEFNLCVPQDIAIVSFDKVEFGKLLRPCLTTLDYDWEQIGEQAARLVLQAIRSENHAGRPERVNVPVQLVVQESCGCRC